MWASWTERGLCLIRWGSEIIHDEEGCSFVSGENVITGTGKGGGGKDDGTRGSISSEQRSLGGSQEGEEWARTKAGSRASGAESAASAGASLALWTRIFEMFIRYYFKIVCGEFNLLTSCRVKKIQLLELVRLWSIRQNRMGHLSWNFDANKVLVNLSVKFQGHQVCIIKSLNQK